MLLPENLDPERVYLSKAGERFMVKAVSKTGEYGEKLYRLLYLKSISGFQIKGQRVWSRDELQEAGVRVEEPF